MKSAAKQILTSPPFLRSSEVGIGHCFLPFRSFIENIPWECTHFPLIFPDKDVVIVEPIVRHFVEPMSKVAFP